MSPQSLSYPTTPRNVNPRILEPSPEFRKEALKAVGAIVFFVFMYIVLVVAGVALAALCAAGGIALILLKPMFLTLMLGIGLAGLGVMVLFFLFKFLFKRQKIDRSGLIEITEKEHPRLFQFVRQLALETHTSFPRKIYLSPDVNASVFYNSSFWSMFLPVRKNLQIGLGLVNAVNLSEFKAIIAHEFGHFSQKSMKLGSYVYNMNHIIFNMLYDNDGYERAIETWGNASGYFALFAGLTVRIVKGIQWILQQLYTLINTSYMSLSRQMEFHADTVSATVSGGNHLITSLRRLEVADITYNNVFGFYQQHFTKGFKPENIYPQHSEVMRLFSEFHSLPVDNGLPQVDAGSFARFNKSRVVLKDQWASHPSTDDRERHLRSLAVETPAMHESPWQLFEGAEALQRMVTTKAFQEVKYEAAVQLIDAADFRRQYREEFDRYQLPSIYKGYFDSRYVTRTDLRGVEDTIDVNGESLEKLLSEETVALPQVKNGLINDLDTLAAIRDGHVKVKTFEFDGKKYRGKDAGGVYLQLQDELKETERLIGEADRKLIAWFIGKARENGDHEKLRAAYSELFLEVERTENDVRLYAKMQELMMPLFQTMTFDAIQIAISQLKLGEPDFRERLSKVIDDPSNVELITDDQRKSVTTYLSKEWDYFRAQEHVQEDIDRLNECLYALWNVASEREFKARASVLNLQLELIGVDRPTIEA